MDYHLDSNKKLISAQKFIIFGIYMKTTTIFIVLTFFLSFGTSNAQVSINSKQKSQEKQNWTEERRPELPKTQEITHIKLVV